MLALNSQSITTRKQTTDKQQTPFLCMTVTKANG